MGTRRTSAFFETLRRRTRGHPRAQRAGFLVASASLVLGSMVAVTGTTAATAGQAASVGVTSLGTASHLQTGTLTRALQTTSAAASSAAASTRSGPATSKQHYPTLHRAGASAAARTAGASVALPTVDCTQSGPECATISRSGGGATTNPYGLAATANGSLYGFDIEPPDQGLCAGNGYVMESINIGEIRIYNASSLGPVTGASTLDSLMGLTGLGWSSAGDIMCQYDADNGGHWFITEIVSTTSEANGGAFAPNACFFGGSDACREGLAVSTSANPTATTWNVYFVDPNSISPTDPGAGQLLNDYAKTATTRDAFLMFYDEFNLGKLPSGPCPGTFGCFAFNGAQQLAIQKSALELGDASVNLVHENMGTDPSIQPPDGSCNNSSNAGLTCWFQVIPATSPTGDFNNSYGGSGFMVATTDFQSFEIPPLPPSAGDNRAAVFFWTGLSNLNSTHCNKCGRISFGGDLFTGLESYTNNTESCLASGGQPCSLGTQRAGTLDTGTYCNEVVGAASDPCPESGLATNGDGATQASYAGGQIWFAVSTLLSEKFGHRSEDHMGGAYFAVGTQSFTGGNPALTLTSQGYVAAAHEDLEFPTVLGSDSEGAVMSFTLSGNGGPTHADHGGFFPSSAYGRVTTASGGLEGNTIDITAAGQAPQDGFTEYQPYPTYFNLRPRWGDYGAGTYVPGQGFYFASEYIQYPNCSPTYYFNTDPTCGGTRDPFANFGTSINLVP
jgi:hypothetical protein